MSAAGPMAPVQILLTAVALLAACEPGGPDLIETRLFAMGTRVDIVFEPPPGLDADALLREAESLLRRYEIDFYPWAEGELKRVNDAIREGEAITVSAELAGLLSEARRHAAASKGLFEPDVAALVELWGFHSADSVPAAPTAQAIDGWLASHAGIAALRIDGLRVSATSNALQLDLGGIAKGHIVDRLLALLARHRVRNAMVNAGGDLGIIGARGARPWRVGVQDPRGQGVVSVIELEDGEAAFTSGDYERYRELNGERVHHILDPRSGRPATHTRAVTVIAADGTTADAAATALFVAGPDRWRRIADALGVRFALRIDASGELEMTEALAERIAGSGAAAPEPATVRRGALH